MVILTVISIIVLIISCITLIYACVSYYSDDWLIGVSIIFIIISFLVGSFSALTLGNRYQESKKTDFELKCQQSDGEIAMRDKKYYNATTKMMSKKHIYYCVKDEKVLDKLGE